MASVNANVQLHLLVASFSAGRMSGIILGLMALAGTLCSALGQGDPIDYNVLEELPPDTLLGNIPTDARMAEKYDAATLPLLRYSFLTQPSAEALFSIEQTTGILRTAVQIDRDALCPGMETCTLSMDIAVGPGQYFQVIPIRIEVLDVNDNAPRFSESEVSRVLSESSPPGGAAVVLPIPEDVDSPENGLDRFEIVPETATFRIERNQGLDGTVELRLVLGEHLDREQTDFYQFSVVAYDAGSPPRSGSVTVNITVEDANDNKPRFTELGYLSRIPENLPPGATVTSVTARDADADENGEVAYSFSRRTSSLYGDLFGIEADTGDVYLKRALDAEKVNVYNLVVTATDKGANPQTAQARVTVSVQDMNDNKPQITVNTLTPDGRGQISEVSTIGTFVAHVSVIDGDAGDNGNVTCSLNDTNFELRTIQENQYKIVTNNMFDREEREVYVVRITCRDHGSPSLTGVHHLSVGVLDVNDQAPVFSQTTYTAAMFENNLIDEYVLQVNATDDDRGINAELSYSLEKSKPGYFRINPETGVIRAAMSIDYETVQRVELKVFAVDKGPLPNSATATVIVNIGDRNDAAPSFIQDFYSFGVYENQSPGTEVGVVNAYDPDSEQFSEIKFRLQADDKYVLNAFRIDRETGRITTRQQLDRESIAIYNFRVLAYNPGYDLTGTATVTVYVADENDHAPVVDFPNSTNNTVMISNLVPFGYVVTRIRAHDQDIGNNAQLIYSLIQGNEEGFFDMDDVTGAITISGDLSQVPNRTYNLSVEVMDNGDKPQTAISVIHISVDGTVPYFTHGDDRQGSLGEAGSNSLIVIIVGCISGAVIVALVVAILAIRLQDNRRKEERRYNCRMEAQKMLHGGGVDPGQSPVHTNIAANSLYSPNSKYSVAGSDILSNTSSNDGVHPGTVPEGTSATFSFLEIGSLKNTGNGDGRDARHPWTSASGQNRNCSSLEAAIQGPCQASYGHNQPIREPQALSSFSVMHSEIGQSPAHGSGDPGRHSNQRPSHTHSFPAHTAAINKLHLSPLAEDIQLQTVPWSERPLSLEHDSESACSGEMSNTDSGRGPSEEGEQGHNQHNNQHGNVISESSDSDNQERVNRIGCHGNTGSAAGRKVPKEAGARRQGKPGLPAQSVHTKSPSSVPQTRDVFSANTDNCSRPSTASAPAKADVSGYRGAAVSLPGWENVPLGGRRAPPRPPRTDSLNRPPHHHSLASNAGSQYASTASTADDCSSSTSGSYIVDHEAALRASHVRDVTMAASDV